ncbi:MULTISPECIES: LacI family DNA-binding transcriptional regulator [Blautia]|uniref:LacI family DNA-binding transcriptional regulator n=1 Tax=Blautia TaxID=572511 RepID=UPI001390621B|nr:MULTISPECIES: LacI family DNA-binding transcriptional regulator [Blautia]
MVTIYDVAKRAGVSKTLVSRVLNNQSGVSPESRSRIREAMKELHYKPNTLARSLVLQRTNVVGVILDSLTEQYFFDVIKGVEDTVKENHFRVIFCSGRNDRGEKENYIDFFSNGATDGAIIYGSDLDDADLIRKRAEMEFPFVVVENEVEDANVNNVLVDNTYGSKLAVDHLVEKGCRRIMHVTGAKGTKAGLRRWQGYLAAMEQQGLAQYISVVECEEFGVDQGYDAVKNWLMGHGREELPDAIYFGADNTAFGGMIALEEAGIRIPEGIKIVGFDDDKPWGVEKRLKKLTTIRQPLYEVGAKAVQVLLGQIQNPETPRQKIIIKPELVIRETTE